MPATTPTHGFPYPVGGDPIDVAGDIQRLAEAIDGLQMGGEPLDAWPIGSIYISVVATDPTTLFGGTWAAFGTGRVLIGVDPADPTMATPELVGGAKTITLAAANMPAHTHTGPSHTHAGAAHTHTIAHTHPITHDHGSVTATTAISAAHAHAFAAINMATDATNNGNIPRGAGGTNTTFPTDSEAGHTHTVAVNLPSFSGNSGASSAASSGAASATTTGAAGTGATGTAGGGTAFNSLNPFIAVHMWKRTA